MIKRYLFEITLIDTNKNFGETLENIKRFLNERDGVHAWACYIDEMEQVKLKGEEKK